MTSTTQDFGSLANGIADDAKTTAGRVGGEIKKNSSVIGTEIKNFITDIEEIVTTKSHGNFDIGKIKSDISSRISDYKASAEAAGHKVVAQAKHQAEGVNTYVHNEPWKAIGAGMAVGLLLGVVISRR